MEKQKFIPKIFSNRLFQHIAFWLFFLFLESLHIYDLFDNYGILIAVGLAAGRLSAPLIITYLNLMIYIPRILEKKNTLLYLVVLIITLVTVSYSIFYLHETFLSAEILNFPKHEGPPKFAAGIFGLALLLTILSALIHFTKSWIKLKDIEITLKEENRQRLEAELKTLKAQINPHFLFNSLNNIYSLSLDKSDLAPKMILRLSDLMSYIIYEARDEKISMKKELEFIKNHVELEGLRVQNKVEINFYADDSLERYNIAPLLFTPFIENTFKYVARSPDINPYINIEINDTDEGIYFFIENSSESELKPVDNKKNGIGIKNVQKRLELIYPGKHDLQIENKENYFRVNLRIKLL